MAGPIVPPHIRPILPSPLKRDTARQAVATQCELFFLFLFSFLLFFFFKLNIEQTHWQTYKPKRSRARRLTTVTRDGIYSDSIVRASRSDSLKMSALTDGHAREHTGLEGDPGTWERSNKKNAQTGISTLTAAVFSAKLKIQTRWPVSEKSVECRHHRSVFHPPAEATVVYIL